jgi:KRAB domain-containing zinc finger protein
MKSHKCDICGKEFSLMGHLKRHKKSHTGDKPYKCDVCYKVFTQKEHCMYTERYILERDLINVMPAGKPSITQDTYGVT